MGLEVVCAPDASLRSTSGVMGVRLPAKAWLLAWRDAIMYIWVRMCEGVWVGD